MPTSNSRSHKDRNDWGVMEMARERPIAAAAAAAGAAAAGLFLWSKRNQISNQISNLSDQIGEWTDSITSTRTTSSRRDDTAGLTTRRANIRSGTGSRSTSGTRKSGTRKSGTQGRGITGSTARGTSASPSQEAGPSGQASDNS